MIKVNSNLRCASFENVHEKHNIVHVEYVFTFHLFLFNYNCIHGVQAYQNEKRVCLFGFNIALNILGHIATVTDCSSFILTNESAATLECRAAQFPISDGSTQEANVGPR